MEACGEGRELFELGDRQAQGGGAAPISHPYEQEQLYALSPHCPSFPALISYECGCASVSAVTDGAMKKRRWKEKEDAAALLLLLADCDEAASFDSARAVPSPACALSTSGSFECMPLMTLDARQFE